MIRFPRDVLLSASLALVACGGATTTGDGQGEQTAGDGGAGTGTGGGSTGGGGAVGGTGGAGAIGGSGGTTVMDEIVCPDGTITYWPAPCPAVGGAGGGTAIGGTGNVGGGTAIGGTGNVGGGTAIGGTGGAPTCDPGAYVTFPVEWTGACTQDGSCQGGPAATWEHVPGDPTNPGDGGMWVTSQAASVSLCEPADPAQSYLVAFDGHGTGQYASFEIVALDDACGAERFEYFGVGDDPTDVGTGLRTYCVPVPGRLVKSRIGVLADGPEATVRNVRLVASCPCVRDVQYETQCGHSGQGGSSGCL